MEDSIGKEDCLEMQNVVGMAKAAKTPKDINSEDCESQQQLNFCLKGVRHGFIMKVYSILMVQLSITSGCIALFIFFTPLKGWIKTNGDIVEGAECLAFVLILAILLNENARKEFPTNVCLLFAFTVCKGIFLGSISSHYDIASIFTAGSISVVTCFSLIIFAFQTRYDFTGSAPYVCVAAIVLFLFGMAVPFPNNSVFQLPLRHVFYSGLGALLFSFYLIYDTQLIIVGKHKNSVAPEEYVLATLTIYMDLVTIFKEILTLLMKKKENEDEQKHSTKDIL